MNKLKKIFFVFSVLFLASYAAPTYAKGNLTLYCSVEIEVCEILIQGFTKETGIDVAMTRKSSGETYAQIKAEASNPKGDVWFFHLGGWIAGHSKGQSQVLHGQRCYSSWQTPHDC